MKIPLPTIPSLFVLVLVLVLLSVCPQWLLAQEDDLKPTAKEQALTISLYWENDGTFAKANAPTDRYYTNGTAITASHQPPWAKKLFPYIPFNKNFDANKTAAGYVLGQLIFTPENINTQTLQVKDRPYAGYLYGGTYWQRANDTTLDHIELNLGIIGPTSQGDETQQAIHRWRELNHPEGWNNQLRDEFTSQIYLRRKWKHNLWEQADQTDLSTQRGWAIQIIPQASAALGSVYRHLEVDATLRAGFNLPDDFGPGRLADLASATGNPITGLSVYGFVRVGGRAVEHNIFLEGNNYRSSHGVAIEELVGELQTGFAAQVQYHSWLYGISYSQTFQTREFEHQPNDQAFGSLMLNVTHVY